MFGINALPGEQKALELHQRHWLNLRAEPVDGEPMNAGQQTAIAPFDLLSARMKLSAQNKSLGFEASMAASISVWGNRKNSAKADAAIGPMTSIRRGPIRALPRHVPIGDSIQMPVASAVVRFASPDKPHE
jgi:hypothetical protein